MNRILTLIILAVFNTFYSSAQSNLSFDRQDSLRGYLFPERACYDVSYYHLDIAVNMSNKKLEGSCTIYFTATSPFARMQIDLYEQMEISSITAEGKPLHFEREGKAVFIDMGETVASGANQSIVVHYGGRPVEASNPPWDGGFVWSFDDHGQPWVGVACEGDGASLWWPCKDHLTDEPDSMLISIAINNKHLMAVANGILRSVDNLENNWRKYNWFVSNPINSYNVTLNIADYGHFQDQYISGSDTLALDYYVLRDNLLKAKEQFKQVKPMLACYEALFGPYPFWNDGFKLVETFYLGMEHQSAIAYGNGYQKGYLGYDASGLGFDYIIIHETAHEYFGNSISAGDLAELWIHESFATYAEALYVEYMSDYETAVNYLKTQRWNIMNRHPIVGPLDVNFNGWHNDSDMYYKGSWLLHTIRSVVDDDEVWKKAIYSFCEQFRHRVTNTREVITHFNHATGKNLDKIFQQYLYFKNIPELEFKLIQKGKDLEYHYRWKADVAGFDMPIRATVSKKGFDWIYPTTEWQMMTIRKMSKYDFKVETDRFYIKQKKVEG